METELECVKLVSPDGRLLRMNAAGLTMLEASSIDDVKARPLVDFVLPEYRAVFSKLHRLALEGEGNEGEIAIAGLGGTRRWLRMRTAPLLDAEGRVESVISIGKDITAERDARERLVEAEQHLRDIEKMEAIGLLAGGMAHDFNNMLGVIIGAADLAELSLGSPEEVREYLDQIRTAALGAKDLTDQLMTFARRQPVTTVIQDLNTTVPPLVRLLRSALPQAVSLGWRASPEPCPVRLDPVQLNQLLSNLVVNARDAIGLAGEVLVSTRRAKIGVRVRNPVALTAGEYVCLCVADDGSGMTDETRARAFEPFFTTKGSGRGTGLGLATVYGIAQHAGGGVEIESEVGRGTTIRVYLPLES